MAEDRERIARLEQQQESMQRLVQDIHDDVRQLRTDWTRAKGFWAGVVLILSAIAGIGAAVWQFVRHKIA